MPDVSFRFDSARGWFLVFLSVSLLACVRSNAENDVRSEPFVASKLAVEAAADHSPHRVLFIGNSYTYAHGGLDALVERLAGSTGLEVDAELVAAGGYTLERHWSNDLGTRDRIASGDWDVVVLQEQSLRPITEPQLFFEFARRLDADIRASGAKTVLFSTWARRDTQERQREIDQAYCSIASELGAGVAPVGRAWQLARERDPSLELYQPDGSHPSELGHRLAGLVLFRAIWGRLPLVDDVGDGPSNALFERVADRTAAGCGLER